MKKNILIIRSSKLSSWGSCKVISPNLQVAYENLKEKGAKITYFDIPELFLKEEFIHGHNIIESLVDLIKKENFSEIVLVDHVPNPPKILLYFEFYIEYSKLPPLVFHVYGDFTFFASDWQRLSQKLKGHPVKFIVASESQKRLMNFFSESDSTLEQFLFPVNESEYYFSEEEREQTRKKYGIKLDERVILYSGRVSLQKNVDVLVQEFQEIYKYSTGKAHLWIVGSFDDIGATFMGVGTREGYLFAKINNLMETLDPGCRKNIHFFGHQGKKELRLLKNGADMFVSLSLYHDEDYGMSPAEALSCGLPSLLTDWGGYSSFANPKWDCYLMSVKLTPYGHLLKVGTLLNFYKKFSVEIDNNIRERRAKDFISEFGIIGSTPKLEAILKKPYSVFSGFKWSLGYYSNEFWSVKVWKELSKQLTPSSDTFYNEVYQHYISGNTENKWDL